VKLPAFRLAATFARGVALGLFASLAHLNISVVAMRARFLFATAILLLSAVLVRKEFIRVTGCNSLSAWVVLGILGAWLASRPAPSNHVLSLISTGKTELSTPIGWARSLARRTGGFSVGD
jgi:hypothetical protein